MINLMISNVIRDDTANKAFGFATDEEGDEYFLPRAVILRYDIQPSDMGVDIKAKVRPNPAPREGQRNLPHVTKIEMEES